VEIVAADPDHAGHLLKHAERLSERADVSLSRLTIKWVGLRADWGRPKPDVVLADHAATERTRGPLREKVGKRCFFVDSDPYADFVVSDAGALGDRIEVRFDNGRTCIVDADRHAYEVLT
jgi:hypothetical protein